MEATVIEGAKKMAAEKEVTEYRRLEHARVQYLQALEDCSAIARTNRRAIKWEHRAFVKLILIKLPGGRAPLNGHKWKAPKI